MKPKNPNKSGFKKAVYHELVEGLEGRNLNITKQFSLIIQVFQDFKLTQETKEEIKKFQLDKTETYLNFFN